MSNLNWDDPNYVDPPRKYSYSSYENKYKNNNYEQHDKYSPGHGWSKELETPDQERDVYKGRVSGNFGSMKTESTFSESIGISQELVGRIIGRAGSNIIRLQNDFNVRVNVDRANLIVKVSGQSKVNVSDAVNQLCQQINNINAAGWNATKRSNLDGSSRRSNYDFPSSPPPGMPLAGDLTGVIDWDALNKASEAAQAARWAKCPPLTKDFYKEWPEVANLSQEDVDRIRLENNNITVAHVFKEKEGETAPPIPNPIWRFEQCFAEYPDLLAEIEKQGFQKPSPIQSQAWPVLLKGHDMIGIAQTGSGKTLAFLLPGMIHTEYQSTPRGTRGGPNVLVLAPTRELALQIEMEVKKYFFRNMKAVCVYGGGSRQLQISEMERGAEIIICTPGRLNDLVQAGVINLSSVTYLVLDEADRMLDMGFEPQIRKVLLDVRPDRQTIMTSATWPPGVRRLAESYMNSPMQVCVGTLDLTATHSIKQVIEHLDDDEEKFRTLKTFIENMSETDKIIVFCGRKARADDLSSDLTLKGFFTQCIHGNKDQIDRERAIADIKSGAVRILIATDVASRGLDIEDITHVINYDFPRNIEEYVHRVGRTGRAGRKGTSISFITRDDWALSKDLINILEEAKQVVSEELHAMSKRFTAMKERRSAGEGRSGGGHGFGGVRRGFGGGVRRGFGGGGRGFGGRGGRGGGHRDLY